MDHSHNNNEYEPTTYIFHSESHGTKVLWRTFIILLIITIIDFAFYFAMPASLGRNIIFIALGIVKARFIVFDFMHMKHETASLVFTILLPILFIAGLILGLLYEGHALSTY